MRFSNSILAMAVPLAAYAAPLSRRQLAAIDTTVLQFADVLEQLESQFYQAGLQQFQSSDYTAAGFTSSQLAIQQITNIQSAESTHDSALQSELQNLGASPITSCSFDFSSALTDVSTMLATARVVENLGVMAYLGAASLITDPQLLEIAGSILTTEARHQTMLNVLSGTGTAIPSSFDLALTPSEVLAVASPFISGCDLGVPANPTLTITNSGTPTQGTSLTFSSSALNSSVDLSNASCQMLIGGNPTSISLPYNQCVVPNTVNGPVAIFITSDNNPLQPDPVNRASANNILAGPAVAFIDADQELIGQMVRTSSGTGTASASTTTSTISPGAAESIIASGTAVASGAAPVATDSASNATSIATSDSASNATSVATSDSASNATSTATSTNDLSSDPSAAFMDTFTGLAPGGAINVIGWSNV